ncbi:MAG: hypothetical protein OXU20_17655 [Myxococcales bacterium]|nr:hypothetical protein [Myxococcales bacterium]
MDENRRALTINLWDHVFGAPDPSRHLLDEGRFPANWVSRYRALVESATNAWGAENEWPSEAVSAVHFASLYLQGRYDAWRVGGNRNEKTESQLTEVRGASEAFLMLPVARRKQTEP